MKVCTSSEILSPHLQVLLYTVHKASTELVLRQVQAQHQDSRGVGTSASRGRGSASSRGRGKPGSRRGGPPSTRPSREPGSLPQEGHRSDQDGRFRTRDNGWPVRGLPPRPNWDPPVHSHSSAQGHRSPPHKTASPEPKELQPPRVTSPPVPSAIRTRFPPSPRSTSPRSPDGNDLTVEEKHEMIDVLIPKIKEERSLSPAPLDSAPSVQVRTEGSDHIPMRADCVKGTPDYREKRKEWKEDIVRRYAAERKQVKVLIRADGMAVDWVLASSSEAGDAVVELGQEQNSPTSETPDILEHASAPQLSEAALAVARSALERLGVRPRSGADVPAAPPNARSPSPETASSDSSGLAPRKRKRPSHLRIASPDGGTSSKHGGHQRHQKTLAGRRVDTEGRRGANVQGKRRPKLSERPLEEFSEPVPGSTAEQDQAGLDVGSNLEPRKSKKRKRSPAPESTAQNLPSQPDQNVGSSTPKPTKEKISKVLPIYEESDETVARTFLMQFLRLFDTNRLGLRGAYHSKATFSYQLLTPSGSGWNTNGTDPRLFAPEASALGSTGLDRNPGHPGDKAGSLLGDRRVGSTEIILCLQTLKNWIHGSSPKDAQGSHVSRRFVWSISCLPLKALDPTVRKSKQKPSWRTGMVLDCHGDLVDPTNTLRCLSFDRTFVLKENNDPVSKNYWPCVILSDQLTIRARSEHPPRKDDETELF
ncbi:nuclear mRNA export, poly(A)+RNA binding protein [Tulasnella sp. UAMH 9824]|nr:nuclear mRNA export, poly(A)+RNA binding protein [Tulasnella sp. UAMH 9824]